MMNPFTSELADLDEPSFCLHPDIATKATKFRMTLDGIDLLKDIHPFRQNPPHTADFKSFNSNAEGLGVYLASRMYTGRPYVDIWVYAIVGNESTSQVSWTRVDRVLTVGLEGTELTNISLDPEPSGHMGHGQGYPLKFLRYNFQAEGVVEPDLSLETRVHSTDVPPPFFKIPKPPHWLRTHAELEMASLMVVYAENKDYKAFDRTIYVPAFPGKTGDQEVFGINHILPDYLTTSRITTWRKQLYMEGCRPGHFLHSDGKLITDDEYPRLVLDSSGWFHPHSKGDPWFAPSDYNMMARTPDGTKWTYWDDQHWGLGPLMQSFWMYNDMGLELLARFTQEGWLFTTPLVDKGPTHHSAGAARAQGRELEAGAHLWHAFKDPRVLARIEGLLINQFKKWDEDMLKYGTGLCFRSDGIAPWEHGIKVMGQAAILNTPVDEALKTKAIDHGIEIAKWVLSFFLDWGNGDLATPYVVAHDRKSWSSTPSYGLSIWCLPAMQLLDQIGKKHLTIAEQEKLARILDQYIYNKDIPSGGGWSETWEHLIY